ncbi:MAG: hypothetical protein SWQ30_10040 [Thermodesulfobacteriota bacterium]|nr:hypothetical protein [Thermodesulfobacteriota bacterium]
MTVNTGAAKSPNEGISQVAEETGRSKATIESDYYREKKAQGLALQEQSATVANDKESGGNKEISYTLEGKPRQRAPGAGRKPKAAHRGGLKMGWGVGQE